MTGSHTLKGQCLCGAVELSATVANKNIGACHCDSCRRWGGGPLLSIDCGTDVDFKGEENIASYQSSDWAQRGFCRQCGSHLFYRLNDNNHHMIPVGLFDNSSEGENQFLFDHQFFIDKKPDFYQFANDTKALTGEEVFAMFAPPES